MERNSLGRLVACGPALQSARVLLRDLYYPGGVAIAGKAICGLPKAGTIGSAARPFPARGIAEPQIVIGNMPGYPARLGLSRDGGFWLSRLRRAHASGRVRAARGRFPRGDDADHPARVSGSRPRSPPAVDCHEPMQFGSHQGARHREALGAAALLRASGPASTRTAKWWRACTAGSAAAITASPPRVDTAQGLVIVSKGSGRVLLDRSGASHMNEVIAVLNQPTEVPQAERRASRCSAS